MEVDIDGSFSYAEPQNDAKDNGKYLIVEEAHLHLFSKYHELCWLM